MMERNLKKLCPFRKDKVKDESIVVCCVYTKNYNYRSIASN